MGHWWSVTDSTKSKNGIDTDGSRNWKCKKKNLVYVVVGRLLLSFTFFYVHFLPVLKLIKKSTFRICRNLFRVIGVTDQEWLDSSTFRLVVVGCSKWLPKSVFRSKRYRITYYSHHKGLIWLNKATSGFGKL